MQRCVREGGTSSRSLSQDAGLPVGALSSNSSVGGEGEGRGNLYYCPQAAVKSEKEFRDMATGAAGSQLWLGKMVKRKDFGVRQN